MKLKYFCSAFLALFMIFYGSVLAQSKSPIEESLVNFDKLASVLNVNSVLGKPIRSGNFIVIPFARISFGLGAGGAFAGYGGGMGGKAIPAGLLIIEGKEARIELFPLEEKKPSLLQDLLPVLLKSLPDLLGGKFSSASKPPETSKSQKPAEPVKDVSLEDIQKLFFEKKYSEALGGIDSLLSKDPNNAEYHAWKGNIMGNLAGSGNPMDMMKYGMGAMQEFEKALALDSANVTAHFGRGIGRLVAPEGFGRDYDGAIQDLEFVCKKEPSADSYYYLGNAYQGKGLKDKSIEAYKKALSLKPDYKEAAEALTKIK